MNTKTGSIALMALSFGAHAQDESAIMQGRQQVREAAQDTLSTLYEYQPSARYAVEHAAGYAVFSTFGIKLLFAGGQQGKGMVVNNRTHRQTFMKMVGVQAGLGFGVAKTRLVFIFETVSAMQSFINQGWAGVAWRHWNGSRHTRILISDPKPIIKGFASTI